MCITPVITSITNDWFLHAIGGFEYISSVHFHYLWLWWSNWNNSKQQSFELLHVCLFSYLINCAINKTVSIITIIKSTPCTNKSFKLRSNMQFTLGKIKKTTTCSHKSCYSRSAVHETIDHFQTHLFMRYLFHTR